MKRIVLSIVLSALSIIVCAQSRHQHILSVDLVGPVSDLFGHIYADIEGNINTGTSALLSYQYCSSNWFAYSAKLGLQQIAFYITDTGYYHSQYDIYVGQEYRIFPFRNAPNGLFFGPMFQGIFGVMSASTNFDRGDIWYFAGIGGSIGYQILLGKWVMTATLGYSGGIHYTDDDEQFRFIGTGLKRGVEVYLGRAF